MSYSQGHLTAARVRLEAWQPPSMPDAPLQLRALACILEAAVDGGGLRIRRAPVRITGSEDGIPILPFVTYIYNTLFPNGLGLALTVNNP